MACAALLLLCNEAENCAFWPICCWLSLARTDCCSGLGFIFFKAIFFCKATLVLKGTSLRFFIGLAFGGFELAPSPFYPLFLWIMSGGFWSPGGGCWPRVTLALQVALLVSTWERVTTDVTSSSFALTGE